jgi:hypothetical protein
MRGSKGSALALPVGTLLSGSCRSLGARREKAVQPTECGTPAARPPTRRAAGRSGTRPRPRPPPAGAARTPPAPHLVELAREPAQRRAGRAALGHEPAAQHLHLLGVGLERPCSARIAATRRSRLSRVGRSSSSRSASAAAVIATAGSSSSPPDGRWPGPGSRSAGPPAARRWPRRGGRPPRGPPPAPGRRSSRRRPPRPPGRSETARRTSLSPGQRDRYGRSPDRKPVSPNLRKGLR